MPLASDGGASGKARLAALAALATIHGPTVECLFPPADSGLGEVRAPPRPLGEGSDPTICLELPLEEGTARSHAGHQRVTIEGQLHFPSHTQSDISDSFNINLPPIRSTAQSNQDGSYIRHHRHQLDHRVLHPMRSSNQPMEAGRRLLSL